MALFSMTKTVLKSLFSKPATRPYPFTAYKPQPNTRGSIGINIDACIYCGMCVRKCPCAAIVVDRQARTWSIDRLRCVTCNGCVDVCPVNKKAPGSCLTMRETYSAATSTRDVEHHKGPEKAAATPAAPVA